MIRSLIIYCFYFLFLTGLSAQRVSIPFGFLERKGDVKLTTGYTITLYNAQYEGPSSEDVAVSIAYSPTKQLGLKFDYTYLMRDLYSYGNGYSLRSSIGGYLPFMKQHKYIRLFIDDYIGYEYSKYSHSTPVTYTEYIYNTISNSTSFQVKLNPYPNSLNNPYYKVSVGPEVEFTFIKAKNRLGQYRYVDLLYSIRNELGIKRVSLFYTYIGNLSTNQHHQIGFTVNIGEMIRELRSSKTLPDSG